MWNTQPTKLQEPKRKTDTTLIYRFFAEPTSKAWSHLLVLLQEEYKKQGNICEHFLY